MSRQLDKNKYQCRLEGILDSISTQNRGYLYDPSKIQFGSLKKSFKRHDFGLLLITVT